MDEIANATSKLYYTELDVCDPHTILCCIRCVTCVAWVVSVGVVLSSKRQLIKVKLSQSESRGFLGRPQGPLAYFVSEFRRLFFVPTVRRAVPQALLCSLDVAFFDGQCKHKHAGTGAGRQEHAATRSPGRLDQEPRSTRQNSRTKVSLRPKCRLISPHLWVVGCCAGCVCEDT